MESFRRRLTNKQIVSREGTGLNGVKTLYSGNCPESLSVAQCKIGGLDPGSMHRADSYSETNTTLVLVNSKAACDAMVSSADKTAALTNPTLAESLRKWVQQCASPQNGTWATGW